MKKTLLATMAALVMGLGFGSDLAWADKKEGNGKGQGQGYSKGHGSGKQGYGHGSRYGRRHGTTGHLIRGLLSSADEMGLTEEQIKKLKAIQLDLDRTRIKTEADIMVAEREARALIEDGASDLSGIEAKLNESARLQVSLRMAAIKARRDAMAVLTPEQSKRVKMFHERMKQHMGSGDYPDGKGQGHKKKKEKEDDD